VIPTAFLQAWSTKAPWPDLRQVEQDLIICRALCDLFNAPALAGKIAFRGGTAIHKLLFKQPLRYSEDIDLVQAQSEPIGGTVDAIRADASESGWSLYPDGFRAERFAEVIETEAVRDGPTASRGDRLRPSAESWDVASRKSCYENSQAGRSCCSGVSSFDLPTSRRSSAIALPQIVTLDVNHV